MSPDQSKKITYDLALEYVKQHQMLSDVESNISIMVEHFGDVCEKFNEAVKGTEKLQKLF